MLPCRICCPFHGTAGTACSATAFLPGLFPHWLAPPARALAQVEVARPADPVARRVGQCGDAGRESSGGGGSLTRIQSGIVVFWCDPPLAGPVQGITPHEGPAMPDLRGMPCRLGRKWVMTWPAFSFRRGWGSSTRTPNCSRTLAPRGTSRPAEARAAQQPAATGADAAAALEPRTGIPGHGSPSTGTGGTACRPLPGYQAGPGRLPALVTMVRRSLPMPLRRADPGRWLRRRWRCPPGRP
jgi:hypothetical protein